jgi:hypothetical protein
MWIGKRKTCEPSAKPAWINAPQSQARFSALVKLLAHLADNTAYFTIGVGLKYPYILR